MKKTTKILSFVFALVMAIAALPVGASAETEIIPNPAITIGSRTGWGGYTGTGWCYRTWTGKPLTPKVAVFDGDKELVDGKDYEKAYGNNIDMGYCHVKVTGIGEYEDSGLWIEALCEEVFHSPADGLDGDEVDSSEYLFRGPLFVIRPLGTTLNTVTPLKKGVKVTWKRQAKKMSVDRVTGYQIQFSPRKDFKRGTTKTITVKGYKNTAKTVKKLKGNKKYYVRVRTYYVEKDGLTEYSYKDGYKDGFNAYSTWSKAKAFKTKK
ncbi:MAG: fibronectin type III domain-containing protein [Eubacterium sp.]|nr:fibronectin type III domain-containing protein [Eubacterium sp.]